MLAMVVGPRIPPGQSNADHAKELGECRAVLAECITTPLAQIALVPGRQILMPALTVAGQEQYHLASLKPSLFHLESLNSRFSVFVELAIH